MTISGVSPADTLQTHTLSALLSNAWRTSPAATAVRWSNGAWQRQPHLNLISDLVSSLNERPLRLIVSMPPRHGKSEMLSHWTPVWYLANNPTHNVGLASYAADFASTWGRKARQTVEQNPDLNIALSDDRSLVHDWELTHGGGMMTAGVGGPFTGRGFNLMVVDDPIKNRSEANSPTIRNHIWNWWTSTARTRLEPGGSIIVVMCVAEGQRVLMGDGRWKPIQNIEPGEKVYSWDGTTLAPQSVKAKIPQGYAKTLVVTTDRHSLTVTPEHPFLTRFGTYVRAEDLRPGDMVETVDTLPRHGKKLWLSEQKRYATKEFLWLLGYLWGDGWVTRHVRINQNNAVSYAVCCSRGVRAAENDRVESLFRKWFGGRPYATAGGYFRLDSNSAGRLLERLGLKPGVGAKGKSLPDWIWGMRSLEKRAFLEGLLDADGTQITNPKHRSRRLVSASHALIEGVRSLALTCGVRPTGGWKQTGRYQPPNSPEPVDAEFWGLDLIFEVPGRALRRWRVKEVHPGPVVPTYDLSVAGTENFVAEGFVVHNTRWHEDDLVGRLLNGNQEDEFEDLDEWHHVRFPALAEENDPLGREENDPLWPTRYDTRALANLRVEVGPQDWAGLFQQRPAEQGGGVFKLYWWAYTDTLPKRTGRIIQFWDTAFKEGQENDYSACATMYASETSYVLQDMYRQRMEFPKLVQTAISMAERYMPSNIYIEDAASGQSLIQALKTNTRLPIIAVPVDSDKVSRANAVTGQIEAGNVLLPSGASWLDDFLDEVTDFPGATHDDQVDAFVGGLTQLALKPVWSVVIP